MKLKVVFFKNRWTFNHELEVKTYGIHNRRIYQKLPIWMGDQHGYDEIDARLKFELYA